IREEDKTPPPSSPPPIFSVIPGGFIRQLVRETEKESKEARRKKQTALASPERETPEISTIQPHSKSSSDSKSGNHKPSSPQNSNITGKESEGAVTPDPAQTTDVRGEKPQEPGPSEAPAKKPLPFRRGVRRGDVLLMVAKLDPDSAKLEQRAPPRDAPTCATVPPATDPGGKNKGLTPGTPPVPQGNSEDPALKAEKTQTGTLGDPGTVLPTEAEKAQGTVGKGAGAPHTKGLKGSEPQGKEGPGEGHQPGIAGKGEGEPLNKMAKGNVSKDARGEGKRVGTQIQARKSGGCLGRRSQQDGVQTPKAGDSDLSKADKTGEMQVAMVVGEALSGREKAGEPQGERGEGPRQEEPREAGKAQSETGQDCEVPKQVEAGGEPAQAAGKEGWPDSSRLEAEEARMTVDSGAQAAWKEQEAPTQPAPESEAEKPESQKENQGEPALQERGTGGQSGDSDQAFEDRWYTAEKVWLVQKDGFVLATVLKPDEGTADLPAGRVRLCIDADKTVTEVDEDHVHLANPPELDQAEDLAFLASVNESSVLNTLLRRYQAQLPHTCSGPDLIVLQPPGPPLPPAGKVPRGRRDGLTAHIGSLAQRAYWALLSQRKDQSIVALGRSGAGKTTCCQQVLEHLVQMAGSVDGSVSVEKIQATFTVLRAFGSVPMSHSRCATRFTMVMSLDFNATGRITAAQLQTMLLEKSRVARQPEGEGNFEVFSQMLAGLDLDLSWPGPDTKAPALQASASAPAERGAEELNGQDAGLQFRRLVLLWAGRNDGLQGDSSRAALCNAVVAEAVMGRVGLAEGCRCVLFLCPCRWPLASPQAEGRLSLSRLVKVQGHLLSLEGMSWRGNAPFSEQGHCVRRELLGQLQNLSRSALTRLPGLMVGLEGADLGRVSAGLAEGRVGSPAVPSGCGLIRVCSHGLLGEGCPGMLSAGETPGVWSPRSRTELWCEHGASHTSVGLPKEQKSTGNSSDLQGSRSRRGVLLLSHTIPPSARPCLCLCRYLAGVGSPSGCQRGGRVLGPVKGSVLGGPEPRSLTPGSMSACCVDGYVLFSVLLSQMGIIFAPAGTEAGSFTRLLLRYLRASSHQQVGGAPKLEASPILGQALCLQDPCPSEGPVSEESLGGSTGSRQAWGHLHLDRPCQAARAGSPSLTPRAFSASRTELSLHQMADGSSFGMGTWPKAGHGQVGAPELDTGLDGRLHEDARTDSTDQQREHRREAVRAAQQPRGGPRKGIRELGTLNPQPAWGSKVCEPGMSNVVWPSSSWVCGQGGGEAGNPLGCLVAKTQRSPPQPWQRGGWFTSPRACWDSDLPEAPTVLLAGEGVPRCQCPLAGASCSHVASRGSPCPSRHDIPGPEDKQKAAAAFAQLQGAMETLGIAESEQRAIWRVLAALYHLGVAGACKERLLCIGGWWPARAVERHWSIRFKAVAWEGRLLPGLLSRAGRAKVASPVPQLRPAPVGLRPLGHL
ncbi:LOW QUALITY PROTEIN: Unconventional myosin-XVIIIb, partial [Galemys pyrenaicus]